MKTTNLFAAAMLLAPKTLAEIAATVDANLAARRPAFAGLTVAEIQEHNRAAMALAFDTVES